jgi:hypothetical protein
MSLSGTPGPDGSMAGAILLTVVVVITDRGVVIVGEDITEDTGKLFS